MSYADSIEDAVEIAQKYDMHDSNRASFHYMVTDKSGRSAILEWVNEIDKTDIQGNKRKLVVTYNDDDVVLIHDDLLATGGSMRAAYELVKKFNPKKIYISFIIELTIEGLHGRDVFADTDAEISTLLTI